MDRMIQKPVWYKRRPVWYAAAAAVLLVFIYIFFLSDTSSKLNVNSDKISIEEVKRDVFQDFMSSIGTVYPIRTIYLDAQEGGRIDEILVEEGSMVKTGEAILRLSNPNLNLSIMNSEAELAEKSNFLRNTQVTLEQNKLDLRRQILELNYRMMQLQRNYDNSKKFYEQNLISNDEYRVAKENYEFALASKNLLLERQAQDSIYRKIQMDQLEESLSRMRENISLVRQRLTNLTVCAPVDGQLGMLDAEIGEQKTQGQRLGLINDLSAFKVQADIDEHYISRITTGLVADFEFDNKSYQLKVKKVYPEVRNGKFLIDLTFTAEMPKDIRTGQTFRVKLQLGESKEAMLIPRGGFYQSTGGQWIFVVDKSGKFATKRNIKIGRQNPQYYEVLEGLEPGEQVVISSYESYGDVDKLILRNER